MADTRHSNSVGFPSARIGSVLVPVDGSPVSIRALKYAAHLRPDRLLLLRVDIDEPLGDRVEPTDPYERWRYDYLSTVRTDLEELAKANADAANVVETKIRFGNPAEQIMAEALDHDLIVMGATGKGAAGRLLFGSVTDRVMRHAVTPTLVVRGRGEDVEVARPVRVVVPLDGSELAERALPVARDVAEALSLPIRLLRCVDMEDVLRAVREARSKGEAEIFASDEPFEVGKERAETAASAYLDAVREQISANGQDVTCDRLSGSPAFELLWDVGEDDLVVMTSRGVGGIRRWLIGSIAEKMVREAEAPVLLVPVGRADADFV